MYSLAFALQGLGFRGDGPPQKNNIPSPFFFYIALGVFFLGLTIFILGIIDHFKKGKSSPN
jgi:hypothetical protein